MHSGLTKPTFWHLCSKTSAVANAFPSTYRSHAAWRSFSDRICHQFDFGDFSNFSSLQLLFTTWLLYDLISLRTLYDFVSLRFDFFTTFVRLDLFTTWPLYDLLRLDLFATWPLCELLFTTWTLYDLRPLYDLCLRLDHFTTRPFNIDKPLPCQHDDLVHKHRMTGDEGVVNIYIYIYS